MDSIDPQSVGSARPGDSGQLFLDQDLVSAMTIAILQELTNTEE